jgi:type I restriction enzyme S subunit
MRYSEFPVEKLPESWDLLPLKSLAQKGVKAFTDGDWIETPFIIDNGVRLLQTGNIGIGKFKEQGFRYISEETFSLLNCTEVFPEDILICRLADPVGRSCLAPFLDTRMITSVDVCILKPKNELDSRYIVYYLSSDFYLSHMSVISRGSTRNRVSRTQLGNIRIALPNTKTQKQIADFLDKETTRIDTLIAKKQRQIELLQEKRQAIITQAVTKGLDPTVKMKDSGVEWIGEIPEHWDVIRLKYVSLNIVDCPHSTPVYSQDGEYPAIRTADIVRGKIILDNTRFVEEDVYFERIQRLKPTAGDIIYSREGERYGMAGEVPEGTSVCLGQRVMMFRIKKSFSNRFVMWSLNSESTYNQAKQDTFGSTSPHVNVETIKNFYLPSPPLEELKLISEWIDREIHKTDSTILTVNKSINLLKEYRSSLITHAVSGQIDISKYEVSHE